jgi:aryl-alcohol dehydrogenase-like predicted oxidoreductase
MALPVAQTVVAWTVEQAGASRALVGARDSTQAVANAKAGEVHLTDEEIKTIRVAGGPEEPLERTLNREMSKEFTDLDEREILAPG